MIAVWGALAVATAVVALLALGVWGLTGVVVWPEEAPLNVRENRAHDQELGHLARLLAAADPQAAHATVRAVADDLVATSILEDAHLDASTTSFLAAPPTDADTYRRRLADTLDRIEDL